MIVEIATGKVYCGETEQSYSDRWHGHVCTVGRYQRNQKVGTDQMYKRLARRGMQGYIFLPWREVSIGGKQTRRRLEKMIIYQFPATLNVEFHRNQHGLSDTRKSGVFKGKGRKRESRQHCRSKEERGTGCKIDGVFSRGDGSNGRSTGSAGHQVEGQCNNFDKQAWI